MFYKEIDLRLSPETLITSIKRHLMLYFSGIMLVLYQNITEKKKIYFSGPLTQHKSPQRPLIPLKPLQ